MKRDAALPKCCNTKKILCGKSQFSIFIKILSENRKILIWGATFKSNWVFELCRQAEVEIAGYIDNNSELLCYQELPVYRPEILNRKEYYLFVAMENKYPEVIQQIEKCGLKEFQDYIYPSLNPVVITESKQQYFDMNGNEIQGTVDGFQVRMSKGSKLIIGKNCKISKSVIIQMERNATLIIGDDCSIAPQGSIIVRNNAVCQIGNNCCLGKNCVILCMGNSMISIGDGFSCDSYLKLGATQASVCTIGEDCLFASDVRIQCSDSHNYYDLENEKNIGKQKEYIVSIGKHVWVGAKSNLLYGTDIGAGSIVGLGSFVNKKFPENAVLAGFPAKVVRENAAWSREGAPYIEDKEYFEKYRY